MLFESAVKILRKYFFFLNSHPGLTSVSRERIRAKLQKREARAHLSMHLRSSVTSLLRQACSLLNSYLNHTTFNAIIGLKQSDCYSTLAHTLTIVSIAPFIIFSNLFSVLTVRMTNSKTRSPLGSCPWRRHSAAPSFHTECHRPPRSYSGCTVPPSSPLSALS